MKILCISGKAQHGKDFTAECIKKYIEEYNIINQTNFKVLIIHYGDYLKFIAEKYFSWDGKKDKKGRELLQHLGTDVVRKEDPDFWVDNLINFLNVFKETWDYVLIPDCRFPNEIDKLKDSGFDVTTIRVCRPNFDNGLTPEQKSHISETALDEYDFDFSFINSGDEKYKSIVKDYVYILFSLDNLILKKWERDFLAQKLLAQIKSLHSTYKYCVKLSGENEKNSEKI